MVCSLLRSAPKDLEAPPLIEDRHALIEKGRSDQLTFYPARWLGDICWVSYFAGVASAGASAGTSMKMYS